MKKNNIKTFNKLVRDKIPKIIESNNEIAEIKILNNEEYKAELIKKLLEEYNEVINSNGKDFFEELADMLEVIEALAINENISLEELLKIKQKKKEKRGGFENKIFLKKTYTKETN